VDSEDTLSLFPQPPPLNLRSPVARSPTPSQYPLTPDYTPTATPTNNAVQPSSPQVRKPNPVVSILKKSSSYYNFLPSPPMTPSTPSILSRNSSGGSSQTTSSDPLAPILHIRNSSPHLGSARLYNVHRPTSSDSCSAYSVSSRHMDHNTTKQLSSTLLEAYLPETQDEARPPSPEPDYRRVQWGYAVWYTNHLLPLCMHLRNRGQPLMASISLHKIMP